MLLATERWGSGESNIRRWIIENDMLEAVVGMTDQLFYNTGISTYIWIVSNRKHKERRGKVQLINGTDFAWKMKKSLGDKRKQIGDGTERMPNHIEVLTKLYGGFEHDVRMTLAEIRTNIDPERDQAKSCFVSKIFDNQDFGYLKITVERPLRLNFQVTNARIARARRTGSLAGLLISLKRKSKEKIEQEIQEGRDQLAAILRVLRGLRSEFADGHVCKDRSVFAEQLTAAFEDADACYDRALAVTPRDLAVLLNKGRSMMILGRDAEALTCFDQLLAINPRVELAWLNKGNLLATSGRHEDAVSCFDQVIAINSTNADAHNNKATSLAALGRREEALASCDRALEADPRHADAWVGKGAVLAATGKVADAVACYDKALAIDAKNVIAWCRKGGSLASSGDHSQALVCFDRALAMKPQNAAALFATLFGKAISEEMMGRLSDAANTLRKVIEVAGPTYAGEVAAAKKHLSELVRRETQTNDETGERLNNDGLVLRQVGRLDDALICYEKALEIVPQRADVWCNKGNALHALGRYAEALECFDKAVDIEPRDMKLWCNRGVALKALGRLVEAVIHSFCQQSGSGESDMVAS